MLTYIGANIVASWHAPCEVAGALAAWSRTGDELAVFLHSSKISRHLPIIGRLDGTTSSTCGMHPSRIGLTMDFFEALGRGQSTAGRNKWP